MSATSPSIEVQREAAATLCNIALAEENKIVMARGGALPALVSLLQSNDPQRSFIYIYTYIYIHIYIYVYFY
jgi:hypothetical protein